MPPLAGYAVEEQITVRSRVGHHTNTVGRGVQLLLIGRSDAVEGQPQGLSDERWLWRSWDRLSAPLMWR